MNEKLKIIYKNVDELIPYENNPRNNDAAVPMVAESIKDFGFKIPIVIDSDNVIVAGHTRLKAAGYRSALDLGGYLTKICGQH